MPLLLSSLAAWLPELLLLAGGMAALLAGAITRRSGPAAMIVWGAILSAGVSLAAASPVREAVFFGFITLDPLSQVMRWLALAATGLVVMMAHCAPDVEQAWSGEFLGLIALVGAGLMLMAESAHLLMAVVSMELVSLTSYCLAALPRDARASEAGLKYLLFGALSSGIMLFGISLLYGLTGQLSFEALPAAIEALGPHGGAAAAAVTLILAGVAYKISMVPFHMWTPDVYEGAPVSVAALLSVGPKAAGLALLIRLAQAAGPAWGGLAPLILGLTLATMTLGNVTALLQTNVKRLLAYSTIGQVGYLLIGFAVGSRAGIEALLVYLTAYVVMNLGAFACVSAVHRATGSESLEAFKGLSARAPALAACLAVFLLSLAGIPPMAGFIGKFLLFSAALDAHVTWLAIGGILNSALALYYYVNIIRLMYLHRPERQSPVQPSWALGTAVGLCAVATLWLGLFPSPLLAWVRSLVL